MPGFNRKLKKNPEEEKQLALSLIVEDITKISTKTHSSESYWKFINDIKQIISSYQDDINGQKNDNDDALNAELQKVEDNMLNLSLECTQPNQQGLLTTIESMELPPPLKMHGRSRRTLSCTIKIPKKKKQPTTYSSKTDKEKIEQLLGWFINPGILELAISKEYKITTTDLAFDRIDGFNYTTSVDINLQTIVSYLDAEAFAKLLASLKKKNITQTCLQLLH